MFKNRNLAVSALIVLALATLGACSSGGAASDADKSGDTPPPPEVGVVTVAPQPLTLTTELPGRLEASRIAEVRARVAGIVLKREFQEGSDVEAGEVLYRIDPAQLQAALNSAEAALAKAEANLKQARLKAERYKPLTKTHAISQLDYDEAVAVRDQAAAEVAAAKAAVEAARLNLGYATVTAPIAGRIGRALVTEGALVGQGEATPLAIVQQIDPIYLNLTQSSAELLRLQQTFDGQAEDVGGAEAKVILITEDGREYPHPGRLLFSDISVDESTGAVTLRAEVPNPRRTLLPGMYVRARLERAMAGAAITVPQQAVSRSAQGASVMVVGEDGKAAVRPVVVGSAHGESWVIHQGLEAGDRVIVDGLQKVRPGAPVTPVAWQNPLLDASDPQQAASAPGVTLAEAGQAASPAQAD